MDAQLMLNLFDAFDRAFPNATVARWERFVNSLGLRIARYETTVKFGSYPKSITIISEKGKMGWEISPQDYVSN